MSSELDDLKAEVAALKRAIDPPPRSPSTHQPIDYTANASMPASALKAMIDAVPESVMRGLRADALKPNPITGGAAPQPEPPVQRGSGWAKPIPIESPPGIEHCDRMMDAQDEIDKAELTLKLAKARLNKEG
jgi:hypothetical protein